MIVPRTSVLTKTSWLTRSRGARGWGWYNRAVERMKQPAPDMIPYDAALTIKNPNRPKVFMDISIDQQASGRIVIELANDATPRTCQNFLNLCTSTDPNSSYKGSVFHSIYTGTYISGGDITNGNGTGGKSSFETAYFQDENFILRHSMPGVVAMTNSGVDTNASQFFISVVPQPHLNGRYVAFGRVIEGLSLVENISKTFQIGGKPRSTITISDCGALST